MTRTIIEPFRIKMTEPVRLTTREERVAALNQAHHNLFLVDGDDVMIDLLTDSGTGAMSTEQWAAMMRGDESYAGSRSWKRFEAAVRDITGMQHILPTHQGRAAERILATALVRPGMVVPSNSHFDTTRANMEVAGAEARDLPLGIARDTSAQHPFKGNMDLQRLEATLREDGDRVPFVMMTVTNNTGGGQPVSLENLRGVRALCDKYGKKLVLDACRFAENAYFIWERELKRDLSLLTPSPLEGEGLNPLLSIAREMFALADASTMSAKKDGLANIGGWLITRVEEWLEPFRNLLILTEGFPTYGGLAGRDLEAIAVGLMEALDPQYQAYRHATVSYMARALEQRGIPIVQPPGGHAIFLDAAKFCDHLGPLDLPGIGLINALYVEGGVRAVELGTLMFGKRDAETGEEKAGPLELVRLAFPRRVYTQSHFDYVIEALEEVWEKRRDIPAHRIAWQPPFLRHFTARLAPKWRTPAPR